MSLSKLPIPPSPDKPPSHSMTGLQPQDYQALVEQAPALIWRAGGDGRCDYVSPAWCVFTGQSFEEAVGEGWIAALHPDDAERWHDALRAHLALREGFQFDCRLRGGDGMWRDMLARVVPRGEDDRGFAGFIAVWQDIVRRDSADDFFEMSRDNVCVAGFDGYFKRVNPSWTRTLGWTPDELMAQPVLEFVHPDDRVGILAARDRLYHGEDMGPLVNRYRCKDGGYRWFEWRSVGDLDRKLVYAVARDVTEQKHAEEQLREAQKREKTLQRQLLFADRMASMGTLAAGVAHEINNPLAYVSANINMMLENIRDRGELNAEELWAMLLEMGQDAREGAERIRRIIQELNTFTRSDEEQYEVIEIAPLIEKSIDMTFNEIRHRARLVRNITAIPPVKADRSRLGQVFVNLLLNAAQAIPEADAAGAEIRIRAGTDEQGRAVIEVSDTGAGIPAAALERVFDPFFTTKEVGVGTGLGLYISHNIVTALGGEIGVSSEEGRGSTFRVTLPPAAALPAEPAAAPAPAPQSGRAVVLVVDDEAFIGHALRRILRDHDVTAVTTAPDALALLEQGRRFDVIFSDIMMPEMSGMAFYDELTRRFPDAAARVVFVSGGTFTDGANGFLDRVPNEFLAKPFTNREVREIVQRYVGRAATT